MRRPLRATWGALLAMLAAAASVAAQTPAPGTLLGSTGKRGGSLVEIDPSTGAATFRGTLGAYGPVTDIVFRSDGVLFGATGGASSSIVTIDLETGTESLVGVHATGAVHGLEFIGGTLYGAYFNPMIAAPLDSAFLVTVDQVNAALTIIGSIGYFPVRGLAYDADDDILYGVGTDRAGADQLLVIDRRRGAGAAVGPVGSSVGSLRFSPDGVLYAGEVEAAGRVAGSASSAQQQFSAGLLSIDTATGVGTVIGDTGQAGLSGLAFVPDSAGPRGIPSATGPGLVVLVLLIVASGLIALLRRFRGAET